MNELTPLEYLSAYLPYELKGKTPHGMATMVTLSEVEINSDCEDSYSIEDGEFIPYLHPLSRLTEEIEHKGENIVASEYFDSELRSLKYNKELKSMAKNNYYDNYLPYFIHVKLIEWHFDVFNLIESGKAIAK